MKIIIIKDKPNKVLFPCCKKEQKLNFDYFLQSNENIICFNCNNHFLVDYKSKINLNSQKEQYNLIFIDRLYSSKIENILFEKENVKYSKKLYELLKIIEPPCVEDFYYNSSLCNSDSISTHVRNFLYSLEEYSKYFIIKYKEELKELLENYLKGKISEMILELNLSDILDKSKWTETNKIGDYFHSYISVNSYIYNKPKNEYIITNFYSMIISGININGERIFKYVNL
jgi:hypothetical protein